MVTITGFQKKKSSDGKSFNVLNLMGGVETVKSSSNGKPYLTARKANVICGLSDDECRALVNSKLPGRIDKVPVDEYDYQIPGSDEVIKLNFSYQYNNEPVNAEEAVFGEKVSS